MPCRAGGPPSHSLIYLPRSQSIKEAFFSPLALLILKKYRHDNISPSVVENTMEVSMRKIYIITRLYKTNIDRSLAKRSQFIS